MSASVRVWLRAYRALLGLMPRTFRDDFAADAAADVREMLREAEGLGARTVFACALRACADVLWRLPGEWWAVLRSEPAGDRRGAGGRRGIGERTMGFVRQLRLAARTLAKRPGFTAVSVVTLALGIGANVAIFSIVNGVLLRPLPYEDSDGLVEIRHHAPGLDLPELNMSEGLVRFYDEYADFLEATAVYGRGRSNLTTGSEAARVSVVAADPKLFEVLRVQPLMGRPFNPEDATEDGGSVVLLDYDTWKARFGSDPSVLGRVIELDGTSVEVVGVMPEDFAFPDADVDLYRALYVDPDGPFGTFGLNAVSRLTPDVSVDDARARTIELLPRITDYFERLTPSFLESSGFSVSVETLRDRTVANVRSTLWIVLGAVAFLLLIACANVANLFLVRAESRQKEMAVRAAMGAGRAGVAASFLGESLVLGAAGGLLGVMLARSGVEWVLAISDLPRAQEVSVDGASLALAGLLSVVAAVFFGLMPMARYAGARFAAVLRDGGRGSTAGRERHRARNLLVATQLALALVLLVGSGLMMRSFAELRSVDLGVEPEGVLTLGLNRNQGEDAAVSARFFQDAADRVAALPGVERVGITNNLPLADGGANGGSFYIESKPRDEDQLPPVAFYSAVGPDYFASLGIPVTAGREVERLDWEEARRVVWVNEIFADRFLDGNALGERIAWVNGREDGEDGQGDFTPWAEVVGVVGDVRHFGLAEEDLAPMAYFPLVVDGPANVEVVSAALTVRMAEGRDPLEVSRGAQEAIRTLSTGVPITAVRTMEEVVAEEMDGTSVTLALLGVATAMALFLGAIGLAGVITYIVGQRTREIGLRVALGAERGDVSRMIVRQSMVVTVAGTVLGLVAALGLTRLMEAVLFEVSATDPLTFVSAPAVLVLVALAATWLPVRRAARVDPMEALRAE